MYNTVPEFAHHKLILMSERRPIVTGIWNIGDWAAQERSYVEASVSTVSSLSRPAPVVGVRSTYPKKMVLRFLENNREFDGEILSNSSHLASGAARDSSYWKRRVHHYLMKLHYL